MGLGSLTYKVVLVLHILSVVVGLGTVALSGVYGAEAKKRKGAGGVAIGEASARVSGLAQPFIYAIPVFGIILVLLSDGAWSFSDTWIWSSLVLYAFAIGISHGIVIPSSHRMNVLAAQLATGAPPTGGSSGGAPPQVLEMERVEKKLAVFGGLLNLLLVALIALMVFKPGT